MEFAQRAVLAEDPLQAGQLFRSAFENERKAAEALADSFDLEPTRSVLYRSAATLALDCADFAEAERLAHEGLAGKPPADIAQELRDVLDQAQPELRRSGRSRGRPR
jgi:hypothetical protein